MDDDRQDIIIYNTSDGKDYKVTFYSLEMVLAIGFRVRSKRGTQFRISLKRYWKTNLSVAW